MTQRPLAPWERFFRSPWVGLVSTVLLGAAVYYAKGRLGLAGYAMGVLGVGANSYFLWLAINLLARVANDQAKGSAGSTLTVAAFLLKLPLVVGFMLQTQRLGKDAIDGFLWGLALVYTALIGWAQACRPD